MGACTSKPHSDRGSPPDDYAGHQKPFNRTTIPHLSTTSPESPAEMHQPTRSPSEMDSAVSSKDTPITHKENLNVATSTTDTELSPPPMKHEATSIIPRDTNDDITLAAGGHQLTTTMCHRAQLDESSPGNNDAARIVESIPFAGVGLATTALAIAKSNIGPQGADRTLSAPTIPNDDFNITVLPANTQSDPTPEYGDLVTLQNECPRFRILVIGKANAGKTTLLQKMCNTTEAATVHDKDGNLVDPSVIDPTDGRGIHDINNELTFSSNSNFVFHDSPGFEAGSTRELEAVREFIAEKASTGQLARQLHAIWYCLPTDNARPLTNAEMSFFEKGTGRVPVIAIFTKYDGMILNEYNRLRFEGYDRKTANARAPTGADELFMHSEYYLKRLHNAPYPPTRYIRVQGMHKAGSNCDELSKQTLEALDSKKLQLLFITVQQNNIELCTGWAVQWCIETALPLLSPEGVWPEVIIPFMKRALLHYGHLTWNHDYHHGQESYEAEEDRQYWWRQDVPQVDPQGHLQGVLESLVYSLSTKILSPLQTIALITILLIVAEDSFWLKRGGLSSPQAFKLAWYNYQESTRHAAVMKSMEESGGLILRQLDWRAERKLMQKMQGIIKEFRAQP